jgi:hypothetical protein
MLELSGWWTLMDAQPTYFAILTRFDGSATRSSKLSSYASLTSRCGISFRSLAA